MKRELWRALAVLFLAGAALGLAVLTARESHLPPAPLYRAPVFDGAADPSLIWNDKKCSWWIFYTNRRANAPEAQEGIIDEGNGIQLLPASGFERLRPGRSELGRGSKLKGAARWSIRGNKTQGTITIIRPNGRSEEVPYRVTGEYGVILFNGIKFAFEGAAECR